MNETAQASESQAISKVRWKLSDVLPTNSGKIFQSSVLDALEGMVSEFETCRKDLEEVQPERFSKLLDDYEAIMRLRSRLGSYAYMYFSENTKSQDARTFKARAEEVEADTSNRLLFFELWWKSLDKERIDKLIASAGNKSYFLERLIKTRPYTLPEAVEQAINLKDVTGKSALLQIYHQIRDSFVYEVSTNDWTKHLTEERIRDLFYSSDRGERTAAYKSILAKFEQNKDVLGEIYQNLVRDWRNEGIKLRKYSMPISIRNLANDVPDQAVEALLSACKKNTSLFQRYFESKARLLQMSDFSRTDIYAPLPSHVEETYGWNEGVKLVIETFNEFDRDFGQMAKNVVSESHIDAEPREGKLGGAYCMSVTPAITPYILMSYTGTPRSVATLAHELGHAVHSQLASKLNSQLTYEAPLPLAETASVFGELLLTERLLKTSDEKTKQSLIADIVNDGYSTIMRQAFFTLFEVQAHESIAGGINIDELASKYLENLKIQFGESVSVPENFKHEWLSIPHIYQTPFYCYAYAWGNLLVLALYRQYKQEGVRSFAPRYMRLLSNGGGSLPERILQESGFDIRSESFWQSGFDELANFVQELEKLS
ncbi:MAG: M3 family oligoendopeptidase [Nitrososphaerota archaeon]|nr:M3 family oligoendopeptidase [Nitrososphaerota archaeon]